MSSNPQKDRNINNTNFHPFTLIQRSLPNYDRVSSAANDIQQMTIQSFDPLKAKAFVELVLSDQALYSRIQGLHIFEMLHMEAYLSKLVSTTEISHHNLNEIRTLAGVVLSYDIMESVYQVLSTIDSSERVLKPYEIDKSINYGELGLALSSVILMPLSRACRKEDFRKMIELVSKFQQGIKENVIPNLSTHQRPGEVSRNDAIIEAQNIFIGITLQLEQLKKMLNISLSGEGPRGNLKGPPLEPSHLIYKQAKEIVGRYKSGLLFTGNGTKDFKLVNSFLHSLITDIYEPLANSAISSEAISKFTFLITETHKEFKGKTQKPTKKFINNLIEIAQTIVRHQDLNSDN